MDNINKYTITMYKMIESYVASKDSKNILLEPLACIVKLAINNKTYWHKNIYLQ